MKRTEGYFRGKNDFELFFQGWMPGKPRATLVVTHGLGEHSECYLRLVDGLQKQLGTEFLEIYCWDLRGHGRSEGKRGVVQNLADYSDDLKKFIEFLRQNVTQTPLFLSSHSLGGLITLNTVIENAVFMQSSLIQGLIFSSPLMGVAVEVPAIKKTGAKYLAKYLPSMTMWNEIPNSYLTHEKKIIEEFEKDPLRHDRISSKLYLEMLAYTEKLSKLGHRVTAPVLYQVSAHDKVVSTSATQAFFKTIASQDKTLISYENSYHEIYNDIERTVCFKDFAEWVKLRVR